MMIKIPEWDELVARFGVDSDGDIGDNDRYYFDQNDEEVLGKDRLLEISDDMDGDNDYEIIDEFGLYNKGYLKDVFVDFCLSFSQDHYYGEHKCLGVPKQ